MYIYLLDIKYLKNNKIKFVVTVRKNKQFFQFF
jgi:hypothetical protein